MNKVLIKTLLSILIIGKNVLSYINPETTT